MVGLAKELEGEPFHLVASYNQRGDGKVALHEIFENGLSLTSRNVSATLHARHPGVKGTGYVPYYMVFDRHGDLAHHHQGGPYHGGDGEAVLERVREMLKDAPRIYVGKEPFATHEKLAKEISEGKKLGRSLEKLQRAVADSPDDPELKRLVEAVERHGRNALRRFERDVATRSKGAIKDLSALARAYGKTPWGTKLVERAEALEGKGVAKAHNTSAKLLTKALAGWERLAPVRGNGGQVRNPADGRFRKNNEELLKSVTGLLERVVEEHGELPAGKEAKRLLAVIRG